MSEFVGLEKLSLVDYDGKLACTLFTESCNFRCPFCHNKNLAESTHNIEIPFNEILSFLKTRINKLEGVVITGGEPTLMNDLIKKIYEIKKLGFLVKLDTNGYKPDVLKYLIENKLIDYIAMDIKNSLDKYCLTTGVSNIKIDNILRSIELIKESGIDYEFRTTLVNEFHNEKNIEEIGKLLNGSKKIYLQKFVNREGCITQGLNEVEIKKALEFKCILEKYVSNVNLRGY